MIVMAAKRLFKQIQAWLNMSILLEGVDVLSN